MSNESKPKKRTPITVGWNELIDLPGWGAEGIRAKIDTGARSSSLHVEHLDRIDAELVGFDLPVGRGKRRTLVPVEAEISRVSRVRSSNGHYTTRIFVETRLTLGGFTRRVEINLVDRGDMQFPMLIGRTALAGRYLVDPSHRRLVSPKPKRKVGSPPAADGHRR